jgi:carbonic anhydrase
VPALTRLLENNQRWVARVVAHNERFFHDLAQQQAPDYLWIGCSDSRVPANEIVDLPPGELFVHRNVANLVVHTDLNCLSVLQYAVEVLKVKHVIVTGHYGCGGVRAAMGTDKLGLIDNWLRHLRDVASSHRAILDRAGPAAVDRLCELNVIEQAKNICETTIVQDAWDRGQSLVVHAWVYSLNDGLLRDMGFLARSAADVDDTYRASIAGVRAAAQQVERDPALTATQ